MNGVPFFLAFSAGLLSFLSPCVLPLVPAYIGYMTGSSINNKNIHRYKISTLYKVLGFVLGFSLIFIIMGASATTLGKLIISNQILFRRFGGSLMIVFGLHTMGIIKIKMFYYEKRLLSVINFSKNFSPLLIGMAFAAGWTPCVGPILSSILIYSSNLATVYQGIFLLSVYSLGLSIPFILTALAIDRFIKLKNNILKFSKHISIISGLLLVTMGILVFTNNLNALSRYVIFINF